MKLKNLKRNLLEQLNDPSLDSDDIFYTQYVLDLIGVFEKATALLEHQSEPTLLALQKAVTKVEALSKTI